MLGIFAKVNIKIQEKRVSRETLFNFNLMNTTSTIAMSYLGKVPATAHRFICLKIPS